MDTTGTEKNKIFISEKKMQLHTSTSCIHQKLFTFVNGGTLLFVTCIWIKTSMGINDENIAIVMLKLLFIPSSPIYLI